MEVVWQQLRPSNANTRNCWGYRFQLTPEHLTEHQAQPFKFSYDQLGEDCLNTLNLIAPSPKAAPSSSQDGHASDSKNEKSGIENEAVKSPSKPKRDLYLLLKENYERDKILRKLWDEIHEIPDWVDWDQIARGQDIFYRYGGPALTALAYQSLLGGMGSNRVVETLARTGGFSTRVARGRLYETTQHILECTRSLESIKPGGAGCASSIRVRLLHASVRQRIMALAKNRPGYFDVEAWGVPINDLDCVATIVSFSASLIWIGLPRQGIFLRQQEVKDYIALWRLIAHYTGTPTSFFETPLRAKQTMETLLMHEINPSPTSAVLANNIVSALQAQPPTYPSRPFLEASARWLNGNRLCDALELGRPPLYYTLLMAGQCLFFMGICYLYRSIGFLDRRKNAALRKIFWAVIVEGKHGLGETSVFEFKYIPDFHLMTGKEDAGEDEEKEDFVLEGRYLKTLVVAAVAAGFLAWGLRILWRGILEVIMS